MLVGSYHFHLEAKGRLARRKGMKPSEVERWLASNLAYEPKASVAA